MGESPVMDALKKVIRIAMSNDGVVKGLNQVGKSLDRGDAFLCVLAEDCDDRKYEKGDGKDKDLGKARKIRGCSSLCIRDYGQDSNEKSTIEQYIKDNNL